MPGEAKIKVVIVKSWCDQNISPLAWTRLVVRNVMALEDSGISLDDAKDPSPKLMMSKRMYALLLQSLGEIYGKDQLMAYQDYIKKLIYENTLSGVLN